VDDDVDVDVPRLVEVLPAPLVLSGRCTETLVGDAQAAAVVTNSDSKAAAGSPTRDLEGVAIQLKTYDVMAIWPREGLGRSKAFTKEVAPVVTCDSSSNNRSGRSGRLRVHVPDAWSEEAARAGGANRYR
jgi:hypothetical protein